MYAAYACEQSCLSLGFTLLVRADGTTPDCVKVWSAVVLGNCENCVGISCDPTSAVIVFNLG